MKSRDTTKFNPILSSEGQLRRAVKIALVLGLGSVATSGFAQTTDKPTELDKVEVTGSRIRHVDLETSDTVFALDRSQIQATGASTLGQLLQSIPSFGGTPYNGEVNNGGGTGEAFVNLRGLGAKRTLLLLDGQRLNDTDANSIPSNMIERVEVLKEGAAAIYGTDAIGGVVNFITRKTFQGVEANATYGATQQGGGSNQGGELTWGGTLGSGGSMLMGANYNSNQEIAATDRDASKEPHGLFFSHVSENAWTSSRRPSGKFNGSGFTPAASTNPPCAARSTDYTNVAGPGPYSGVTLIDGQDGTLATDFRRFCNNADTGYTDRYNYQVANLALIPRESYSLFSTANVNVSDWASWYGRGFFTNTHANAHLAAEPFDQVTIGGIYVGSTPTLSNQSFYNPFPNSITNFGKRSTDAGDRLEYYATTATQIATGFKGTIGDTFRWDTGYNYGRYEQSNTNYGFLDFSKIFQQIGPSTDDNTCTSDPNGDPIPNCRPLNVFGTTGNTLSTVKTVTNYLNQFNETDVNFNLASDSLFPLPGGGFGLAVGAEYRQVKVNNTPDALAQLFELSENNAKSTGGKYSVNELYAETRLPLLANLPGVEALTVSLGGRYSDYSSYGSQVSGKYALEYRPYSDLLIRGTYSDVYRAPNPTELFQGGAQTAPSFSDPCAGLTAGELALHPNACAGVPAGYSQPNTQANGNNIGNTTLNPEKGHSTDLGLVFSPGFYSPLSVELDLWQYTLKQAIDRISLNSILTACFNDEASSFCGAAPNGQAWFVRDTGGNVANSQLAYVNANQYNINGIDTAIKFNYPNTPIGRISFGIDTTYLTKYELGLYDPASGAQTDKASLAGFYDANYTGDAFPRIRGLAFGFWSSGPFKASLQDRYVGKMKEDQVDYVDVNFLAACSTPGTGGTFGGESYQASDVDPTLTGTVTCTHTIKAVHYLDLAGTFTAAPIGTDFTVGINDLLDKGSPTAYNANLAGASLPLYDVRGRNFYGRVTIRFK